MSIAKIGLIISVCLLVIGAIFMSLSGGDAGSTVSLKSQSVGVVCLNPDCGYKEAMDRSSYQQLVMEKDDELGITPEDKAMGRGRGVGTIEIPLTCPKCGEDSFISGHICGNPDCGEIFPPQETDPRDKCPKCGYSRIEEIKKGLK
jgi:predicted RNA-binding Zn-ribbon protein involved in translation (DUF1610 family)